MPLVGFIFNPISLVGDNSIQNPDRFVILFLIPNSGSDLNLKPFFDFRLEPIQTFFETQYVEVHSSSEEERNTLMEALLASGLPPALRIKVPFAATNEDSPWRFEFDAALKHARAWRLSKAIKTFNSLKGVAADSPELFTNIALLCERVARPLEAAEAWLKVAELRS